VMVPEIDDAPLDFLMFLHLNDPFVIDNNLTGEDIDRNSSFVASEKRKKISESSGSHQQFLKALQTKVTLFKASASHIERIVQLTNKTNQFNFTTARLDNGQVAAKIDSNDHLVIAVRIEDRFGVYGITSLVYIKIFDHVAEIENWIMSCRVFSKSAEYAIMESVIEYLGTYGVSHINASYMPTTKNMVVADLLPKLGFLETGSKSNGASGLHYVFEMPQSKKIQHYCEVINEL